MTLEVLTPEQLEELDFLMMGFILSKELMDLLYNLQKVGMIF